jgi:hypothetical protein
MPLENPFVYGEIVTAGAFADREDERDRLARDLAAGQKVFLISPRRYGKSSLIRDVLDGLARQGILTVEVTVAASSSYVGFLEAYARALVAAETPVGRLRRWASDLFLGVRPEVRLDVPAPAAVRPVGRPDARKASRPSRRMRRGEDDPGFSLAFPGARTARDIARLAEEVFALPGRIAAARGQRLAIALDEFQALAAFDGGSVEHALRAAVQQQRQVGYVFAGSEPSLMERMVSPRRPFYKAGPVVRLDKIDEEVFADFIETRFGATGLPPEPGLGAAIVELAGNVPYDVQRLAHEAWDDAMAAGASAVGLDALHATLTRLLGEHHTVFEESWQRLTLAQRAVLRAVVLEDGRELLSADVRARHRLSGASSVQSALGALVRQDIAAREGMRYAVVDSLFREWVARRTF